MSMSRRRQIETHGDEFVEEVPQVELEHLGELDSYACLDGERGPERDVPDDEDRVAESRPQRYGVRGETMQAQTVVEDEYRVEADENENEESGQVALVCRVVVAAAATSSLLRPRHVVRVVFVVARAHE